MIREIQNITISLKFPIRSRIRRLSNDIEDLFRDYYSQPTVVPVPDDIEPMIPRITLNSKNNHSTINFSQIGVDFAVNFDSNYTYDYNKCEDYIKERMLIILEFLRKNSIDTVYYIGITTQIKYLNESQLNEIQMIKESYLPSYDLNDLYDYSQKITFLESEKYFHNITIGNYRDYTGEITNERIPALVSFEKADIKQTGIFVLLDINDRYNYTIKGNTINTESLEEEFEEIYASNRKWINKKVYEYLPFKEEV